MPSSRIRTPRPVLTTLALALLAPGCTSSGGDAGAPDRAGAASAPVPPATVPALLAGGQAVFGVFSGAQTPEQGAVVQGNDQTDFVFYSLEEGPFDIPTMKAYMGGMTGAAADGVRRPVVLRIPPIRDGRDEAVDHVRQALDAGVDAVVFPHVENGEEAALAVSSMGDDVWPANPRGSRVNMLIIEDQEGIAHAREIVSTPGVSIAIPGPGDLRRSYDGDMEAVEAAIQKVLAACKEFDVPCGITAGPDDIATRLEQGFRVIIVLGDDALPVGRAAAGRAPAEVAALPALWARGLPAFGVYAPDERPRGARQEARARGERLPAVYTVDGARRLAADSLVDFVFLNLEGGYDVAAVRAMVEGLGGSRGVRRPSLLVRIPPMDVDGVPAAGGRVKEILALGADGVVLPHVRGVDEARTALGLFDDAGADVWSPSNPSGTTLAMLMLEDPDAVAQAEQVAGLGGFSILACGIGSLTAALNGDRPAAERGNQAVLAQAKRAGMADMITADTGTIGERVGQGFQALLLQGPEADAAIRKGRSAAGR